ncbi:TIGR01777 family oxidoreductase [Nocardioides sp.]|uniref:TIGR01777 family oxidoreductase n=1 Tax=Nocardioides sp. TaxID=35761 RepID=UPI001A1ED319|nr:TIGR01777 family oxidoreductase [Nocardioides sp.]MBJ7358552.1 TIGR01777 family oxidoreductase [Nocardioides sp.]
MKILIAGASGFLGRALSDALGGHGHSVVALVRRPASSPGESSWDPYAGTYDRDAVESADVVVNLAGSPTAGNPHSSTWARELRESRVRTTATLATAIAGADRKPAFLAGNGISYYGDRGDEVLTEESDSRGDSLLTSVTRDWQAAAQPAVDAGARVCVLRTSPVMDRRSPPLKQLRLLFKAGLGGRLGDGRQYMPMTSLRDWTGGVVHLAEHDTASGPFNLICPTPPTNAEFTAELARQLSRPSFAVAPKALIRVGAGKMADELLGSVNARPAALEAAGFEFRDRDVADVLRAGLASTD